MGYVEDRIEYEELLINLIKNAQKQNNLIATLEDGQGHCRIHMLRPEQDERDRTENYFKIGTYFFSEQEQKKAINKILEQKLSDIVDWAFGSVDKKCELNITFDKPIGFGVDLRLNKYNISKVKLVLTRDELRDTRFVLTTLFPSFDKDASFIKSLDRRKPEPRLLSFFEELKNEKNKKFYAATMKHDEKQTQIQVTNLLSNDKYTIRLPEDSNIPIFSIDDRLDHYNDEISEAKFKQMEAQLYSIFNKHRGWEKEQPPVKPIKVIKNERKLTFFEKYCLDNNLSYEQIAKNEERLKCAKILLNHKINPGLVLRPDITDEILDVIMKQVSKNERAGYIDANGKTFFEVDVMHYLSENCIYSPAQLNTLFYISSLGIDTTIIENPEFSSDQMNMIKSGINYEMNHPDQKIDLNKIANPKLNPEEIRKKINDEINRTRKMQSNYRGYNGRYK